MTTGSSPISLELRLAQCDFPAYALYRTKLHPAVIYVDLIA